MQGTENATMLLGRVLLSLLFLIGGTIKLLGPAATQAMFVKQGLPMVEAAWVLAVVVELGGGLAMLFGLFTRPVGLVLAIWCVATALIAHSNIADRAGDPVLQERGINRRFPLHRCLWRGRMEP